MGRFARAGDKVCFRDFLQLLAIDLKCCTVKRKCSKDLFSPLFSSVPISCTKIYSCSSGMCLAFKTLSHSCPLAPRPRDPARVATHQSKMRRKVQGVSSRCFLRCQVWNNALITAELRETTSPWPLGVSNPGCAAAVILLISLQRCCRFLANKIKDTLHTSSPLQPPWPQHKFGTLSATAADNSPEMKPFAASSWKPTAMPCINTVSEGSAVEASKPAIMAVTLKENISFLPRHVNVAKGLWGI